MSLEDLVGHARRVVIDLRSRLYRAAEEYYRRPVDGYEDQRRARFHFARQTMPLREMICDAERHLLELEHRGAGVVHDVTDDRRFLEASLDKERDRRLLQTVRRLGLLMAPKEGDVVREFHGFDRYGEPKTETITLPDIPARCADDFPAIRAAITRIRGEENR